MIKYPQKYFNNNYTLIFSTNSFEKRNNDNYNKANTNFPRKYGQKFINSIYIKKLTKLY